MYATDSSPCSRLHTPWENHLDLMLCKGRYIDTILVVLQNAEFVVCSREWVNARVYVCMRDYWRVCIATCRNIFSLHAQKYTRLFPSMFISLSFLFWISSSHFEEGYLKWILEISIHWKLLFFSCPPYVVLTFPFPSPSLWSFLPLCFAFFKSPL